MFGPQASDDAFAEVRDGILVGSARDHFVKTHWQDFASNSLGLVDLVYGQSFESLGGLASFIYPLGQGACIAPEGDTEVCSEVPELCFNRHSLFENSPLGSV